MEVGAIFKNRNKFFKQSDLAFLCIFIVYVYNKKFFFLKSERDYLETTKVILKIVVNFMVKIFCEGDEGATAVAGARVQEHIAVKFVCPLFKIGIDTMSFL